MGGSECAWPTAGESAFARARHSTAQVGPAEEEAVPARAWGRAMGWERAKAGDWEQGEAMGAGLEREEAMEAAAGSELGLVQAVAEETAAERAPAVD